MCLYFIKEYFKKRSRYKRWRLLNPNNNTSPQNDFNLSAVSVGNYTYGGIRVLNFNNKNKLFIGNFCSIAGDVVFVLDAEHSIDRVSSFPFKVKCLGTDQYEASSKGDIVVEDDVWLGYGSIIMSGVHIGQGSIIAAGALVTKDVEPYSIVGGVPAKLIRKRFSDSVIEFLLSLDYSKINKAIVNEHINELYKDINRMNREDVEKTFAWFPKKTSNL